MDAVDIVNGAKQNKKNIVRWYHGFAYPVKVLFQPMVI